MMDTDPARLLIVGTTPRDTQVFLGDHDLTALTQRLEVVMDAREPGYAAVTLMLLPRHGVEIAITPHITIALVPLPGYRWIHEPTAEGAASFRCERAD